MNPMIFLLLLPLIILLAVVALGVALFCIQQYLQPEPSLMQARLIQIKTRHADQERYAGYLSGAPDISRLFKDSAYSSEVLELFLKRYSFPAHLEKALRQAGMNIPVDRFIIVFLAVPMGVSVLLALVMLSPLPVGLGGLFAGGAYLNVRMKQGQRLKKFTTQLPDALSLMTSSLRAGHSFQSALGIVVSELPDPISTELSQVVNDINLGLPVKEALGKLVNSLDTLPDVRMFVTALMVQREAGGNLAEILDKLSYTIRERFKLQGQIKALTGQSRLTGYILGCAPIFLFVGLYFFANSYVRPLYDTDLGRLLLLGALVMQGLGFMVIQKIIAIRI